MTYPFIPIAFIAIFIVYILYLLVIKKDKKQLKPIVFIGSIFIGIWMVIYYLLLK